MPATGEGAPIDGTRHETAGLHRPRRSHLTGQPRELIYFGEIAAALLGIAAGLSLKRYVERRVSLSPTKRTAHFVRRASRRAARNPENDCRIRAAKSPYPLDTYAKFKWPLLLPLPRLRPNYRRASHFNADCRSTR
jgi:hypothetical protein